MQLTKTQIKQIQTSLIISPNLKEKIISKWETFSSEKQEEILQLIVMTDEMQETLIKKALKNNPGFHLDLNNFFYKEQIAEIKEKEIHQKDDDDKEMENLLNQLPNI